MSIILYAGSWLINFAIFAIIAALADEVTGNQLEKHQAIGAFLLFIMPTAIEIASYMIEGKPFFF